MATERENHREDVIGRANVEDTPETLAYCDQLRASMPVPFGPWRTRLSLGRRKASRSLWSGVTRTCAAMWSGRSVW